MSLPGVEPARRSIRVGVTCSPRSGQKRSHMLQIGNLTPHPVTIVRPGREPVTYPACTPAELPRATESALLGGEPIGLGDMRLSCSGSDGQGPYENLNSLDSTGVVDYVGYTSVEGLPAASKHDRMFGIETFSIVSIVTAIGALAGGRGIEDLLVPMGQVRDDAGRIIGASGLAPASSVLTPLVRAVLSQGSERV